MIADAVYAKLHPSLAQHAGLALHSRGNAVFDVDEQIVPAGRKITDVAVGGPFAPAQRRSRAQPHPHESSYLSNGLHAALFNYLTSDAAGLVLRERSRQRETRETRRDEEARLARLPVRRALRRFRLSRATLCWLLTAVMSSARDRSETRIYVNVSDLRCATSLRVIRVVRRAGSDRKRKPGSNKGYTCQRLNSLYFSRECLRK